MRDLSELLEGVEYIQASNLNGTSVERLVTNSKETTAGSLFVAVRGVNTDGHRFIPEAIAKGATAIVVEEDGMDIPEEVVRIIVNDTRLALAQLAASFYRHPSRRLKIIGITGTNGKTTTSYLIERVFNTKGIGTGIIGTTGCRFKDVRLSLNCTTPDAVRLNSLFEDMVHKGIGCCCMEVSSHALHQLRINNIDFDVGVFTNLTQDHLDYHLSLANYRLAKAQLFRNIKEEARVIINIDDPFGEELLSITKAKPITYGTSDAADIKGEALSIALDGITFIAHTPEGRMHIKSPLIGRHNMYNILATIGVGIAAGIDLPSIAQGVESLDLVPGRLESIDAGQPFKVFVDYAHTPDALRSVLTSLRALTKGRLILVFGCGGDRDRGKRPLMGQIARDFADRVFLTADNSRSEDTISIIREIEEGMNGFKGYEVIPERREAIKKALASAGPGACVLIAGKGHEGYQIIGESVIPFDDREVAREILQ